MTPYRPRLDRSNLDVPKKRSLLCRLGLHKFDRVIEIDDGLGHDWSGATFYVEISLACRRPGCGAVKTLRRDSLPKRYSAPSSEA